MYENVGRKTAKRGNSYNYENSPQVENYGASSKMQKSKKNILGTFSKYFLKINKY